MRGSRKAGIAGVGLQGHRLEGGFDSILALSFLRCTVCGWRMGQVVEICWQ